MLCSHKERNESKPHAIFQTEEAVARWCSIEVSRGCCEDYVIFQVCHHERRKLSKESQHYVRPVEKNWQASMVTSCGVIGCNNNQNNCSYGFFRLPKVRKTTPEEENLSLERRRKWLANIKRSGLSNSQLATENSTLKICGNHFYKKQPAKLFKANDPDWVPSINLEHSEILFKSSISRCERRKKRALERSS